MARFRVEFHRLALKDYDEARKWYAERSQNAAERFKRAIDAAIHRVSERPESCPLYSGLYRWVKVQGFQYIVVFRPRSTDEFVVVAVSHSSRRPGYWRRRV